MESAIGTQQPCIMCGNNSEPNSKSIVLGEAKSGSAKGKCFIDIESWINRTYSAIVAFTCFDISHCPIAFIETEDL